ncbi:MAG: RNA-binding protein [Nitrospirota bacterium]|nr:RNA-binding protein [Nitrospirota bacterium]
MQRAVILYGLPPAFTAEDLRELLSQFGPLHAVRLSPPDQSAFTIGYVEMESREQARQAVQTLHGTVVDGQTLIVHRSMPLS